jgi:uncharacterized protein with HEPN domain
MKAGLRGLIAHEYFRIDIHRVLEIMAGDVSALMPRRCSSPARAVSASMISSRFTA